MYAVDLLHFESQLLSVQVAGEFFATATSPKRPFQLSTDQAAEFVKTWLGTHTLYTEDLSDGQDYDGIIAVIRLVSDV